ncbi:protein B4 [Gouania willdenowi]|uniref:Protein B4 n=1 Tax=Gouania willdenowi TaxID=441366 RepID=A0A8C5I1Q0_GOUWI|nr:protein B4 [Gouania willdenowi]
MPPKKAAVVSAGGPELSPKDSPEEGKKAKKQGAVVMRKLPSHPSTIIMVKEAIKALDSRKGVSSQAIQSYIKQHYPSVDMVKLKHLVRRALIKGQENGTLVRPANSTMTVGAQGKFRLAQKLKEAKPKSENTDPNLAKETKKADKEKPSKAGATKVTDVPSLKTKSSEDDKPSKTTIKKSSTSKVPPAKKPKAKKTESASSDKTSETKPPLTKTGKATTSKTTSTDDTNAKATRKRGKMTVE